MRPPRGERQARRSQPVLCREPDPCCRGRGRSGGFDGGSPVADAVQRCGTGEMPGGPLIDAFSASAPLHLVSAAIAPLEQRWICDNSEKSGRGRAHRSRTTLGAGVGYDCRWFGRRARSRINGSRAWAKARLLRVVATSSALAATGHMPCDHAPGQRLPDPDDSPRHRSSGPARPYPPLTTIPGDIYAQSV